MPKLGKLMQAVTTANNYRFTATKIPHLGATEYTLVTIVCDVSGSVGSYKAELERCIKAVLQSCRKNPRANHLLLRLVAFNDCVKELHGFKELRHIDPGDYDGILKISGCTALYSATFSAIDATVQYGQTLVSQGFCANALVFVLTDGLDNASKRKPETIKQLLQKTWQEERLASLVTVLVGINAGQEITKRLAAFKDDAGLNQYIDLGQASPTNLAKLAGFLSRSINISSMSLAAGTSAQNVPLAI